MPGPSTSRTMKNSIKNKKSYLVLTNLLSLASLALILGLKITFAQALCMLICDLIFKDLI